MTVTRRLWTRVIPSLVVVLPVEYVALFFLAPGRIVELIVVVGCARYGCPAVTIGYPEGVQ